MTTHKPQHSPEHLARVCADAQQIAREALALNERLRAENQRLRAALWDCLSHLDARPKDTGLDLIRQLTAGILASTEAK